VATIQCAKSICCDLIWDVHLATEDQDFISRRGTPNSNRNRWLSDRQWMVTHWSSAVAPLPPLTSVAPIHVVVVQIRRDWSLRHRNDEVRPFLLTFCVGGAHGDRATSGSTLLCSWLMARPPSEALVPSSLPTVVEAAREAFPSLGWARGVAEQRNSTLRCGANGLVFAAKI
jgi:hypothetical protein